MLIQIILNLLRLGGGIKANEKATSIISLIALVFLGGPMCYLLIQVGIAILYPTTPAP